MLMVLHKLRHTRYYRSHDLVILFHNVCGLIASTGYDVEQS